MRWCVAALVALCLAAQTSQIRFENVAKGSGLEFTLENSPTSQKHMIETMPGGIAVFDYDNDGRPDVFFTNGAEIPSLSKSSPKYFNRLFHNEGGFHFRDVTDASGLRGEGYSMGVAAGDFDNDGNVDLFVAGVHQNRLYRNLGNGKFEDVTARSGIKSD
ncbi:MAG: VCBS repeat-containing protein, partial [Acidobacteriaceae bacterium]|nr:VCBS repeat-containing protein [Acidobacteriaceae bacterium]